ncbi:MAG: hypothetical protein HC938_09535 [Nitrospira sp.]|nr:hypothetical protein [Nitrospira sp.]
MAAVESGHPAGAVVSHLGDHLIQANEGGGSRSRQARAHVAARVMPGGKISGKSLDREQHAAHGLAWLATYAAVLRELAHAERIARYHGHAVAIGHPHDVTITKEAPNYQID